jgi:methionyl-tRNA formyltransferase
MGSGLYGSIVLKELDNTQIDIKAIYVKSKQIISRKNKSVSFFQEYNNDLRLHIISRFSESNIKMIQTSAPDLILVASFGLILPDSILKIPTYGVINIHPSLLPKYRGPSPISTAMIDGEKFTGVSIMKMVKELDAGPILAQYKIEIDYNLNSNELGVDLFKIGARKLNLLFSKLMTNEITEYSQNNSKATYTKIIKKSDGHILLLDTVGEIYRKYKAYYDWPGIYSYWNNKRIIFKELKINNKINIDKNLLGKVEGLNNESLVINARDGQLLISKLQIEGSKAMSAPVFVNGRPNIIGEYIN